MCCCCPAQCSGAARAPLIPLQCWRVLLSCCAAFHCRVCGVWVVSVCLCCLCGGVFSVRSPLVVVEGGAIVDGGVPLWMVGGMVSEGRQSYWHPRLCAGIPLVVYPVALLNGGWGMCCDALSSDWVRHLALPYSSSYCSLPLPPFVFAVTALLV